MQIYKLWPGLTLVLLLGMPLRALSAVFTVSIDPTLPDPIPLIEQDASAQAKLLPKSEQSSPQAVTLPTKEQAWQAVFDFLGKQAGIEFSFTPASSQLDFELKLAKGYYDFAYVNPLQFIAFNDFPGYKAVAKRKSQPTRGVIFVKKIGQVKTLSELRGATIAFPGTLNFPSSVVPRDSLKRLDVDFIPQFLATEKHVYAAVANGRYVAGGGSPETFEALPPEIKERLTIIWNSPGYTPNAFVAHPRVPFFSIVRLQSAMVGMIKHPEGKALLHDIFVANGFEVASDQDWNDVANIDLNKLNGMPDKTQVDEPLIGK